MSRIVASGFTRQREPRVKDRNYLGWVAGLPCVACACRGIRKLGVHVAHCRAGFPEVGWRPTGMAEKPSDARCSPLCPPHHMDGPQAQHRGSERDWWAALNIFPPDFCLDLRAAYETGASGEAVIRKAAAGAYPFPADA